MVAPLTRPTPQRPGSGRLRVLYLIDSLGHGGAEALLAAYLGELPRLGIDPTVVALQERDGNPTAAALEALGVPVIGLGIQRLRQRGAYREVAEVVARSRPDLVHTQLEFANVLGAAAAARAGLPVVSTLHTLEAPRFPSRAWARMKLMAWSLRRHATTVIAVSDHARRHHLRHLGLPANRVLTIHNGIDVSRFAAADGSGVRAGLEIPEDAPLVVTVAVLRAPKGIDRMLRALPGVLQAVPEARYLVVGDGPARASLEAVAAEAGVADRVTFAGSRADVDRMLAAANVFVLPSLTEALPTVVAEAMAAGLPVVATRVGGTPEMVSASTGVVVEPDDPAALAGAVAGLLADPARRSSMGTAGRRVAKDRFDLPSQAARLAAEYARLAGEDRR